MNYSQELIDLLNINPLIASVWLSEDLATWMLCETPDMKEVTREEILGGKSKKK